jgi:hypothetical protein
MDMLSRKTLRQFLFARERRKQFNHVDEILGRLKENGLYKKYPANNYPAVISKYNLFRKSDVKWLDFYYSVYEKPDPNFVSVPIYFYIEACLNQRMLTYALKEKNFYNKFMPEVSTPGTILRRINGFYYDDQFERIEKGQIQRLVSKINKVILKPSVESGGGKAIRVFKNDGQDLSDGIDILDAAFLDTYSRDFIIQEVVVQHDFYSQFNPSSNNTIRVFLYRSVSDDAVHILHCLLRVGAKGSFLDHDHLGGVVLSIDNQNKIGSHAIDRYGNKFDKVNNIALSSLESAPAMDEVRKVAKGVAEQVYYGRLLALDFTVNRDAKPLLLEINCWKNGISQYQMHNGGLFGEYTEEVLDHCQNAEVSYTLSL